MDINVNVNVKIEETPALIKCLSIFCDAVQSTVGILATSAITVPGITDPSNTEAAAPAAKKSRTAAKKENANPVTEVLLVSQPEAPKITETVDDVEAMLGTDPEPEAVTPPSLEDVRAVCTEFAKTNPDKKVQLAECFQKVGAVKLSEVAPEKYPELLALVKAL